MSYYAGITRDDPSRIKRFIHARRLDDPLKLLAGEAEPRVAVDFGAGDGEFCRRLAERMPRCRIFCYEPAESLRQEAMNLLRGVTQVEIAGDPAQLPTGQADVVFCMEVFEHLPPDPTAGSLRSIRELLRPGGVAILGVPVEVFLPALLKGTFRMTRHRGDVDTDPWNILCATFGRPLRNRPLGEIAPGLPYYFKHIGFDYRRFAELLSQSFAIKRIVTSPFSWLPPWLNNEIYFLIQPR